MTTPLASRRAVLLASAGALPVLAGCSDSTTGTTSPDGTPQPGKVLPEIPCADRGVGCPQYMPPTEDEWYRGGLTLSGDRSELAAPTYYGVVVWSTADGKVQRKGPFAEYVRWNPKQDMLMIDSCAAQARLISSTDFSPFGHLTGHREVEVTDVSTLLNGMAFAPDGDVAITNGYDRTMRAWDVASRGQLWSVSRDSGSMHFTSDGHIVGRDHEPRSDDPVVKVWSLATGEEVMVVDGLSDDSLTISPDGSLLCATNSRRKLRLIETSSFKTIETHDLDHDPRSPVWINDRQVVYPTGGAEPHLALWEVGSAKVRTAPIGSDSYSFQTYAGAKSDTFYLTSTESGITEYDQDLKPVRTFEKPS